MRYLKLWESFRQDFHQSVEDLESKYKSERKRLFSEAKDKVDEFMFDLTEDFSGEDLHSKNFIEKDFSGPLRISIWYYLRCDRKDFEDFIKRLDSVRLRIKQVLDLDMKLKVDAWLKADTNFGPGNIRHPFNHDHLSNWDEMMKYIDGYKGMKPEYGLDQYSYFKFQIQIC